MRNFSAKVFFLTFSFDLSCTISCTQTALTLKRILSHSIPGPYYPCALVGPIVIGTTVGSLGQFFPTDKGLSAINNGLPWPIQGALMTSVFYHLTGEYCLRCKHLVLLISCIALPAEKFFIRSYGR